MKKYIILSFTTLCVLNVVYTQILFNKKYDFGYPAAIFQGAVAVGDSIIISGFVGDHIAPYPNRSFIGVANQSGDINYFQIIDTTDKNYWVIPASITKSELGNYYFTSGLFNDTITHGYRGFLYKFDTYLNKVFMAEYYPDNNINSLIVENHVEYNKDTIALLCSLWKMNAQGDFYDSDILLILADSAGNEYSHFQYTDNIYDCRGFSIEKCDKGLLSASFKVKRYNDNGVWKYANYPNVVLYDIQGNTLQSYSTPSLDYRSSMWATATQDNGYLFCGAKFYNVVDPLGSPHVAQSYTHGYIEKLNQNFVKQWGLVLGKDSGYKRFNKIIETKQGGNYIAAGFEGIQYSHNVSPDSIHNDSSMLAGWAVKVSSTGNIIWNRHYQIVYGMGEQLFSDILEQSDGSLVMSGVAYDESPNATAGTNAWVCKTDSFGCLIPGCQTVGIAENTPIENSLKLYPNPTNDRLFLYYNNPQYKNYVFTITDLTGREVVPNTPLQSSTTYEIVVRDWAKGLYFVRVFDTEGQNVYTEKFVKE